MTLADNSPKSSRRPYEAPELRPYGSVTGLTDSFGPKKEAENVVSSLRPKKGDPFVASSLRPKKGEEPIC